MAKRKLPYMKMWVGDWLSSQKVMELSRMEEFCYFRLIMWVMFHYHNSIARGHAD